MKHRLSPIIAALLLWLIPVAPSALRAQEPADQPPSSLPETEVEASTQAAPSAAPLQAVEPAPPPIVDRGEVVVVGSDVVIAENERASEVVVVNGNVEVHGQVDGEVVAVMGNVKIDGPVGEVVAIMGKVELGPNGSIAGEVISIGGGVDNPFRVPIVGERIEIAPFLPDPGAILGWFADLATKFRLLSPGIAWPWYVFGGGLLFYLVVALVFGRGVNACAEVLERKPGTTLVTAIALLPAIPLFTVLLIATGVGLLLVPFLVVGLLFGLVFGKTAVLAFLGRSMVRPLGGNDAIRHAWIMVFLGAVLLAVLYCVPVLGLVLWALTAWVGLGMVAAAIIEKRRQEKAERSKVAPADHMKPGQGISATVTPAPVAPAGPTAAVVAAAVAAEVGAVQSATPASGLPTPPAAEKSSLDSLEAVSGDRPTGDTESSVRPACPPLLKPAADLASLPRADFWVRFGAILVDIVLIAIAGGVSGALSFIPFPLVFAAYVFALWLWRGTTVGGIVFNLKVVRLDGRPVDAATSLVRTLVAFLSVFVVGLGFLWCLWDPERQTWHDKVAGTVVVQEPKATSLV